MGNLAQLLTKTFSILLQQSNTTNLQDECISMIQISQGKLALTFKNDLISDKEHLNNKLKHRITLILQVILLSFHINQTTGQKIEAGRERRKEIKPLEMKNEEERTLLRGNRIQEKESGVGFHQQSSILPEM